MQAACPHAASFNSFTPSQLRGGWRMWIRGRPAPPGRGMNRAGASIPARSSDLVGRLRVARTSFGGTPVSAIKRLRNAALASSR